jgi:phosphoribosylformylglycinamidine synthase
MWQFAEAVRGLGDACRKLETPVVSGNVSLYNETEGEAIKPTPMIAMVGLLDDVKRACPAGFARAGEKVAVLGELDGGLEGSEYLKVVHSIEAGRPRAFAVERHKKLLAAMLSLSSSGLLSGAQRIGPGGLLMTLARACVGRSEEVGADISLPMPDGRLDELLFGEGPARFLISYSEENAAEVVAAARKLGAQLVEIGKTQPRRFSVSTGGKQKLDVAVSEVAEAYQRVLPALAAG